MNNKVGMYAGYYLIETTAITKRVQRRRHRKCRINKKWQKKYGYKIILDDGKIIYYGDCIFATPKTIKKIIAAMEEKGYGTI